MYRRTAFSWRGSVSRACGSHAQTYGIQLAWVCQQSVRVACTDVRHSVGVGLSAERAGRMYRRTAFSWRGSVSRACGSHVQTYGIQLAWVCQQSVRVACTDVRHSVGVGLSAQRSGRMYRRTAFSWRGSVSTAQWSHVQTHGIQLAWVCQHSAVVACTDVWHSVGVGLSAQRSGRMYRRMAFSWRGSVSTAQWSHVQTYGIQLAWVCQQSVRVVCTDVWHSVGVGLSAECAGRMHRCTAYSWRGSVSRVCGSYAQTYGIQLAWVCQQSVRVVCTDVRHSVGVGLSAERAGRMHRCTTFSWRGSVSRVCGSYAQMYGIQLAWACQHAGHMHRCTTFSPRGPVSLRESSRVGDRDGCLIHLTFAC